MLHGAKEEVENLQFSDFGPAITKATKTLESLLLEAKEAVTGETAEGKKPKEEDAAGQNPADAEKPSEKSAE